MKTNLIFYISLILLAAGCTSRSGEKSRSGSDEKRVYTPEYAMHFTIDSVAGGRILNTLGPWQGADSVTTCLFIADSSGAAVPEAFKGQAIQGPARRIVATSSTHIALLDALGALDRLVAVSGKQFVSNPAVSGNDTIADVGYDSSFDYETLLAVRPDLVLLYGIDGSSVMENHLRELRIPFAYIGDYLEEDPLGKAEWLIAIGAVTGKEKTAAETFGKIPPAYFKIKESIKKDTDTPKKVFINAPYGDSWFVPPVNSYMVRLIEDAGGEYLFSDNTTGRSVSVDKEKAYIAASEADVWLNPGMFTSRAALMQACPSFSGLDIVTSGNIYNNNLRTTATGGNDFYESAVVHPDIVLADLAAILHPSVYKDHKYTYYRRLE